jgi:DNA polymerase I-like protein with 3'-5' exonuclease and polymerase domains
MNWRAKYFSYFPEIEAHWLWIQQQLRTTRMLTDLLGRKYLFLGEFEDSMYREAYSRVPQGTVGGLLTLAMIRLQKSFDAQWEDSDPSKPFVVNQVHDSLEIECDESDIMKVALLTKDALDIELSANGQKFKVPAEFAMARSSRSESWGSLTPLKV